MTMKKKYTAPAITVVVTQRLCFTTASVHKGSKDGEKIDQFDVVDGDKTKGDEYNDLWNDPSKWGDD